MTGALFEEAQAAYQARLDSLLGLAALTGFRLATCDTGPRLRGQCYELTMLHVMLAPGEKPPEDRVWTIWEHRAEGWRGRSA